jgi:hypothetical protein
MACRWPSLSRDSPSVLMPQNTTHTIFPHNSPVEAIRLTNFRLSRVHGRLC